MGVAAGLLDLDDLLEDRRVVAATGTRPRSMTMSTSSAPASTAARVSAILMSRNVWPDGKPVATLATLTLEPCEGVLGVGDRAPDRRRSPRRTGSSGRPAADAIALAHSARTLPGVSFPSSVVRSIIRIARSRAHSFEAFLIDRCFSAVDPRLDADLACGRR